MSGPTALIFTQEAWMEISRHAIESFPEECCGVILSDGKTETVRRCQNIQNQLHRLDPASFPRDATVAYAIDPKELESIVHQAELRDSQVKAFYHSHPNHEAYFSEEDKAFATPFGEPTYPDTAQIVISIYDRLVKRISAYAWLADKKDFVEIPVRIISSA